MRSPLAAVAVVLGGLLVVASCSEGPQSPTAPTVPPSPPQTGTPPPEPPPTTPPPTTLPPTTAPFVPTGETVRVLAVGDIGMCNQRTAVERAAALVDRLPGQLLLAGDLAYPHGSFQQFQECFEPAWGKFRNRWHPVPGNHEYETPNATGYRQYFGAAAGSAGRTYYAFRTGDWLVLMLDSNDSTQVGTLQYEFVRSALALSRAPCAVAVWHHPLFTSGPNGSNTFMREMWQLLYRENVDVIVNGHDHLYERFGKQDVGGRSDGGGIRQFIAGTGGASLYDFQRQAANSQARWAEHGVLQLTLEGHPLNRYQWMFTNTEGVVRDQGLDNCH